MNKDSKIRISWEGFETGVSRICNRVKEEFSEVELIVGIQRGGLPLAVTLSEGLDTPMTTLVWQTRDGETREVDRLEEILSSNKNILIVDDMCDSGLTFAEILEVVGEREDVKFATLISRSRMSDFDGLPSIESGDNRWVIFPWNKKE